jgi:S1-C subfamily serine protease
LKGGAVQTIASAKLLHVESGAIVYQDTVLQVVLFDPPPQSKEWSHPSLARQVAYAYALTGLQASLFHALIPHELGAMGDPTFQGPGAKIFLVLVNSPAAKLGINIGDVIVKINGLPVKSYADVDRMSFSAMNSITVRRGSNELEFPISAADR